MTLKEGKNREIRRMCEAVGLEVIRLKRNAEGVVKLGMLQPGKYRELTKAEVNGLRAAAAKGRAQTRSAALQSKAAARRPRGPVGGNKAAAGKKLLCGAENFAAGFRGTVGLGFTDCGHRFKKAGKFLRLA